MAYRESYAGKINRKLNKKLHVVEVASGRQKADLVLKNATYVNVFCNELSHGDIAVAEGLIAGMGEHYEGAVEIDMGGKLVLPGFVDAHIHLESALVSPKEFANAVIPHGTTTVITDPHEIANVMGTDGIEYMLQATEDLPVDVRFMLPSCVPATPLDESGAILDYRAIDSFYDHPRVQGLAEMMNFVGAINGDEQTVEKIVAAQAHHKKIDGHAPDLRGNDLNAYIAAGVYSDHECHDVKDAIAKLERGQFIMIREGTAARNLEALMPLLTGKYADRCMFCTDDKHPNDLLEKGHIDYIVKKAISLGADPITAVKVACHNAARYFLLNNRGAIAPGYLGDFVIIDSFQEAFQRDHSENVIPAVQHGNAAFRIALEPLYTVLRLFSAVNIRKALLYQRLYLRVLLSGKQFPKPHRAAEKSVLCRNKKYGDVVVFLSLIHQRPRSLCRGHSGAYRNVVCGHSAADLIVVK